MIDEEGTSDPQWGLAGVSLENITPEGKEENKR